MNKVTSLNSSTLLKRGPSQVFCCEFCNIFNTYSVESIRTATSGLINSCETSKWLIYTHYHISVKCRGNSLPHAIFFPLYLSLYAFDFKFYIRGYILIKSIVALSQQILWMLNACCRGSICCCCFCYCFKALTKAKFSWINSFSTG